MTAFYQCEHLNILHTFCEFRFIKLLLCENTLITKLKGDDITGELSDDVKIVALCLKRAIQSCQNLTLLRIFFSLED